MKCVEHYVQQCRNQTALPSSGFGRPNSGIEPDHLAHLAFRLE